MTNNKPNAVDFIYEQLKKYVRYDNRNPVETFDRIFEQAKEMYNDEMEAVIIKHFAEIGTSNASAYSEGYTKGWDDCKTEINNKTMELINSIKNKNKQ